MALRVYPVYFIMLVLGLVLLLEAGISFLFQLIFNDPTFHLPLITWITRIGKALILLLFSIMHIFSMLIGVPSGLVSIADLVTQFVVIIENFLSLVEVFIGEILLLVGIGFESLVVGAVAQLFLVGGEVRDDFKIRRG